jgi:protein O-GlcNAc transferase
MTINEVFQLATGHYEAGNFQQAEQICKEILREHPDDAGTLYFLGIIYIQLEEPDVAIQYLNRSLQFNENNSDTYLALGQAFYQKGQFDRAIEYLQKAISLDPNNAVLLNLLGHVCKVKGKTDEAIKCFQKIIELNPGHAVAYSNLGASLLDKDPDQAIEYFQKALQFDPKLYIALYNLGNALWEQCKIDEAIAAFDKAVELRSKDFSARLARCVSQLRIIYTDQTSIQKSRKSYHDELKKLLNMLYLETPGDIENALEAIGRHTPFYLSYQALNDRELQQFYGDVVCKIMAAKYPHFASSINIPSCSSEEPFRIGFASGFFHSHSVWKIPIKGWIENIDKRRFKLYGYYTGTIKDNQAEVARQCFSQFVEDVYSLDDLCKIIRGDNLHVLIYPEIGMDAITVKLAALRLAPVQCASWGHPDTSGLPTIDYFLSSDLMEPPDADDHYAEKLIRLPNLSIYYNPFDCPPSEANRETFGLRQKTVLYLCCQSLFKYLPQYDEIFPRIAREVDDCKFLFISFPNNSYVTDLFRIRIHQSFDNFGIKADDFVVFLPRLNASQYSAINSLSDIYLDSIGWSGCNSTFEAIACNLPIVTLPGGLMRGRHSSAILTMIGLKETIATDLDEYISLAVKLGRDSQWRQHISDKILESKHLAYRDRTCITALEDFLERVVKERL